MPPTFPSDPEDLRYARFRAWFLSNAEALTKKRIDQVMDKLLKKKRAAGMSSKKIEALKGKAERSVTIIATELMNMAWILGTAKMAIELYEGQTFDGRPLNRLDKTLYLLVQIPYLTAILLTTIGFTVQALHAFQALNLKPLHWDQFLHFYRAPGEDLAYFKIAATLYVNSWYLEKIRFLYAMIKSLTPEEKEMHFKWLFRSSRKSSKD